jgi:hypothetical protein
MPGEACVTKEEKGLGFFEKYLTIWVFICIRSHSQYFLSGEPDIVRHSLFSAAGGSLAALTATGPCFSATTTFPAVHVFSPDSSTDHGPGTADPALYFNSLDRAVEGAGSALHAAGRADKFSY